MHDSVLCDSNAYAAAAPTVHAFGVSRLAEETVRSFDQRTMLCTDVSGPV